jgi:limonene 1,2-monooxygenase
MSNHLGPERFGFIQLPIHPVDMNPTLQLERDLQLVAFGDMLGFDEAYIGEHHSIGREIISAPEVFLAAAAERTKHIRLGTGVVSVPYHNPFHIAQRAVLLDHLTRGRFILGMGPGALTADAHMLDIPVADLRPRLAQGIDVITRLLDGEVITEETDWYKLKDARLQLNSYSRPRLEMATAAVASPSGPRLAGKYGIGMLNLAATSPAAFESLKDHWGIVEHEAAKSGATCSRDDWRLSAIMHIAESIDQAREDLKYGFMDWVDYTQRTALFPTVEGDSFDEVLDFALANDILTIGTPDTAVELITKLAEQTGGFGCFLFMLIDLVSPVAQRRSLELFAERVIPHFRDQLARRKASENWAYYDLGGGKAEWKAAVDAAKDAYAAERDAENSPASV